MTTIKIQVSKSWTDQTLTVVGFNYEAKLRLQGATTSGRLSSVDFHNSPAFLYSSFDECYMRLRFSRLMFTSNKVNFQEFRVACNENRIYVKPNRWL